MRGDFAFDATLMRSEQLPERLQLSLFHIGHQHETHMAGLPRDHTVYLQENSMQERGLSWGKGALLTATGSAYSEDGEGFSFLSGCTGVAQKERTDHLRNFISHKERPICLELPCLGCY